MTFFGLEMFFASFKSVFSSLHNASHVRNKKERLNLTPTVVLFKSSFLYDLWGTSCGAQSATVKKN